MTEVPGRLTLALTGLQKQSEGLLLCVRVECFVRPVLQA